MKPQLVFREESHAQKKLGAYQIIQTDAFEWLKTCAKESIHAVVTDPPYGLVEYSEAELAKLKKGRGGVWRIPPSFDGCERRPLPRFTVLTQQNLADLEESMQNWPRA